MGIRGASVFLEQLEYEGEDLILGKYLETLERPAGCDTSTFRN